MILRFTCLLSLCLSLPALLIAQTIPTPTQTGTIIVNPNGNGKAEPGDRIRYTVPIQNTGGANATGVQLNAVPDPKTTFLPGSFRSSPLAINDSYACTGNVGINVPAANGLKFNDFDDNTALLTVTAETKATNQSGGSVTINADGSFNYTPPAGFTGTDGFTYTLNDGNDIDGAGPIPGTDVGTVTITVSNLMYFINNSSLAATSDGRLTSPYKSLADFNAGSTAPGDVIYIEQTGTNYTGGIVLANNERLFGEGHTGAANLSGVLPFSLALYSKTLPTINGTRPYITNNSGVAVLLASSNTLRGFDAGFTLNFHAIENSGTNSVGDLVISEVSITNTVASGAVGSGFKAGNGSGAGMNVVFTELSTTGGENAVTLTNCQGTFAANAGTITNPSGTGIAITGGSVVFTYSGTITDNSGYAIDIDNHDSGNITFQTGTLTSTGTGIRVQNCGGGTIAFNNPNKTLTTGANTAVTLSSNTGAVINFTNGGLVISSTSGTGFHATGGGTITVQDIGNTISSTSGTALNVVSTTIGASGLNFQSISSTAGTTPGIILDNSGAGGLTVTGDGGEINNGSGGTISNKTGTYIPAGAYSSVGSHSGTPGVRIINASNVRLKYMNITGCNHSGIFGGAPGFDGAITGWLNSANGFQLVRCNISNNGNETNSNPDELGIDMYNLTGTAINGANPTSIDNCVISNNKEFELQITNNSGNLTDFQMNNCTVSSNNNNTLDSHGNLVNFLALGTANMTLNLVGGSYTGNANPNGTTGTGVQADHSGSSGTVTANISNATFTNNNVAISVSNSNGGSLVFDVDNNIATVNRSHGLNLFIAASATGSVNGKFRNNTVGTLGTAASGSEVGYGIRVQNEGSAATSNPVNVLITNNTVQETAEFSSINVNSGIANQTYTRSLNLTITNNTLRNSAARAIVVQQNNNTNSIGSAGIVCANISGNSMSSIVGQAADGTYIRFRQLAGGVFNVTQASQAALEAANTCTGGCTGKVTIGGTITYNQPACTQP